jgi:hypothetical protein
MRFVFIDLSSSKAAKTGKRSILLNESSICSAPQSYYRSYDEYIPIGSPIHTSQINSQSPQQQTPSSVSNSIIQPHSPSMLTSTSPSINQYGYSTVLPAAIITSHQDLGDNQQWNCGGGLNGSTNLSPYQTEFCASNYSIMQRQQYGAKIGPGSSMKSIKEARIRRPMNGKNPMNFDISLFQTNCLHLIYSLHGVGKSGT